jgi:hypothetical protein
VSFVGSTIIYTPVAGYTGPASFLYTISDGTATATGIVHLTLLATASFAPGTITGGGSSLSLAHVPATGESSG